MKITEITEITENGGLSVLIPGIDEEKVLSLYAYNPELYFPILRSYAANTSATIKNLYHITKDNLAVYAINLHGLKGSSGIIGAENLKRKAASLEQIAKAGNLNGVLAENEELLEEAKTLVANIKEWLSCRDTGNKKKDLQL